jgi:glyoxylase I family protein
VLVSDVHHVSINVTDLPAAEAFYVGILGLPRLPRPDLGVPGAWLAAGGRQIHLIQSERMPSDCGQHFAFQVDDLEAAAAALRAAGVPVSKPFRVPGAGCQCFCRDPSGNLVELNQPA